MAMTEHEATDKVLDFLNSVFENGSAETSVTFRAINVMWGTIRIPTKKVQQRHYKADYMVAQVLSRNSEFVDWDAGVTYTVDKWLSSPASVHKRGMVYRATKKAMDP